MLAFGFPENTLVGHGRAVQLAQQNASFRIMESALPKMLLPRKITYFS
jgi:hypothetical protein